ncbi:hypothetical protein GCM10018966_056970 [Streptomyces yanii]
MGARLATPGTHARCVAETGRLPGDVPESAGPASCALPWVPVRRTADPGLPLAEDCSDSADE